MPNEMVASMNVRLLSSNIPVLCQILIFSISSKSIWSDVRS